MKKNKTLIKTTLICALSSALQSCKQQNSIISEHFSNIFLSGNTQTSTKNTNHPTIMHGTPIDKNEYFYNKNLKKNFICPITQDIMENPVIAADGHSYEREAILQWFQNSNQSPKTNQVFIHQELIKNHTLKGAIESFLESQKNNTKAIKNYEMLDENLKILIENNLHNVFIEDLQALKKDWNQGNDLERFYLINELGLQEKNYNFLAIGFKQKLSERTQLTRHEMKNHEGKHPSTEEFWQQQTKETQIGWIKNL